MYEGYINDYWLHDDVVVKSYKPKNRMSLTIEIPLPLQSEEKGLAPLPLYVVKLGNPLRGFA